MLTYSFLFALSSVIAVVSANNGCPVFDLSILALEGNSVGVQQVHDGINMYITGNASSDTAIVYLSDVFGIQLVTNRLLADSFGRAGYLVVAPDLFNGMPAPADINGQPTYDVDAFLAAHGPNVTDPIITATIDYLRNEVQVAKVLVAGYCFGGRYAFRFLAEGRCVDAGFVAHPALQTNDEVAAVRRPVSVAFGDLDDLNPQAERDTIETILMDTNVPYSADLYGGAPHDFAVNANLSDPKQKFAKEAAFFQAVEFFKYWVQ
ncbi:alpha/beta-hydrolase [Xylariomycetidae sp. FL0641]|nr:alpha/beta-hydrolase [Xylariomycetidae sp. FL0641]